MSETRFTPGPWWEESDTYQVPRIWARFPDGSPCDVACAEGDGSIPFEERRANARLIAAAPELYEALKKALDQSGCDGDLCAYAWHDEARAAIAKAEGKE